MGIIQDIFSKIDQIIKLSNDAYVYSEQCARVVIVLKEIRSKISNDSSNNDELNAILDQLNKLYNTIDDLKSENWSKKCLTIPIMKPVSDINEIMNLISESLKKINISLENEYVVEIQSVANDLNSLYGIFTDPSRANDSKVEKKLTEIEKYLNSIGQPIVNPVPKKRKAASKHKSKHHHHKKDKKSKSDSNQDLLTDSSEADSSNASLDEGDFNDFNDVQKYKLKPSDFTSSKKVLSHNDRYTIYSGKMNKTQEDVSIMFLNEENNDEEKFKRLVNVLTAAQHPYLESFVGAVEEPPYVVVTKRVGEKLSDILKRAKSQKTKKSATKTETNDDDSENCPLDTKITLKEGYRTIIAFNIATAMAFLHSLNIIHRDLCSSNITIDKTYNPRITNFANSRFLPEDISTITYKPVVLSNFRAPELIDTGVYDESVDVFAFGGLLYELMMGTIPFGRLKGSEAEGKILNAERPQLPQEISSDLRELIESCWSQDPKNRPSFADVIDKMLSKNIVFPSDENNEMVQQFYAAKSIKNADLSACLQLFKLIAEDVSNGFAYMKESIRIRTLIHGYQFLLQTSKLGTKEEEDSNVFTHLSNLRKSLEDLHSTIMQTEAEKWSTIALSCSAIEIPTNMHSLMEEIYISMTELGFNVVKYDYINSDLIRDFRDIYSIFSEYAETYQQAVQRMEEIETFLKERDLEISITQNEIDERIKQVFTQFKDYELKRDDFKIIGRPIGTGMSAIVYKAKQLSTGKDVAIKEFRDEYLEDEDTMTLLRREVSFLVKLHNEYLVTFIGFNKDPGQPLWVVSEMVKNGELFNAIKRKKLTPFQKTKIAFEIAEGMEYLHSKHVIHRDLKTGNVLLDGDTPKITDFGYARTDLSLGKTRQVGTINYMAPEVIEGSNYDFKADVFSYGLMLWELYSGTFPFSWVSRARVSDEIINGSPLPYKTPISEDLKQLIEDTKMLNPEDRPSFSDIIERMLDNKIAYNGANQNEIDEFYKMKAEKRAKLLEGQTTNMQSFCLSTLLTF